MTGLFNNQLYTVSQYITGGGGIVKEETTFLLTGYKVFNEEVFGIECYTNVEGVTFAPEHIVSYGKVVLENE